jgi:hypothetical protein
MREPFVYYITMFGEEVDAPLRNSWNTLGVVMDVFTGTHVEHFVRSLPDIPAYPKKQLLWLASGVPGEIRTRAMLLRKQPLSSSAAR